MKNEKQITLTNGRTVKAIRVDNDVNGNPRYVVHFLEIADKYLDALNIARKHGGKAYHAKWYGGGIVFTSYNLTDTLDFIGKGEK